MSAPNYWDKLMGSDEVAGTYMETYGEGPGFDTRHTIGEFINEGETVLDVGCGPGWNLDHFKQHGPDIAFYKGLDYSERFVRAAWNRAQGKGYNNWQFAQGDLRDIKEPDTSFDVVILQDCLEHTNGYEKPVQEALRVAKKRVIISFWHLTENDDHINDDGDDGWGAWYSRPKWETFLDELGANWLHTDIYPASKSHGWDFYILDKEESA